MERLPYSEDVAHDQANEMQQILGQAYGRDPRGPFDEEDYDIVEERTLHLTEEQERELAEIAAKAKEELGEFAAFEVYREINERIKAGTLPASIMHLKDAQETIASMKIIAANVAAINQGDYLAERYPDQNGVYTAEQYDEAEHDIYGYSEEQKEALKDRLQEIKRMGVLGLSAEHGDNKLDEVQQSYELTRVVQQAKKQVVRDFLNNPGSVNSEHSLAFPLLKLLMNLSDEDFLEGEYKEEFKQYLERSLGGYGMDPMEVRNIITMVNVPEEMVVAALGRAIANGRAHAIDTDRSNFYYRYPFERRGWDADKIIKEAKVLAIEYKIMDLKFDEAFRYCTISVCNAC